MFVSELRTEQLRPIRRESQGHVVNQDVRAVPQEVCVISVGSHGEVLFHPIDTKMAATSRLLPLPPFYIIAN